VLIPVLYLKGISCGDFAEALAALLGQNAGRIVDVDHRTMEGSMGGRMPAGLNDLSAEHYVYFWVDARQGQARVARYLDGRPGTGSTKVRAGRSIP
jgi:hypothetical protein